MCSWKGVASYYDVVVNGDVNRDAAWYYSDPKEAAAHIANHIAFWHGVRVEFDVAPNDSDRDSSATKEASGEHAPDQQYRKNDL